MASQESSSDGDFEILDEVTDWSTESEFSDIYDSVDGSDSSGPGETGETLQDSSSDNDAMIGDSELDGSADYTDSSDDTNQFTVEFGNINNGKRTGSSNENSSLMNVDADQPTQDSGLVDNLEETGTLIQGSELSDSVGSINSNAATTASEPPQELKVTSEWLDPFKRFSSKDVSEYRSRSIGISSNAATTTSKPPQGQELNDTIVRNLTRAHEILRQLSGYNGTTTGSNNNNSSLVDIDQSAQDVNEAAKDEENKGGQEDDDEHHEKKQTNVVADAANDKKDAEAGNVVHEKQEKDKGHENNQDDGDSIDDDDDDDDDENDDDDDQDDEDPPRIAVSDLKAHYSHWYPNCKKFQAPHVFLKDDERWYFHNTLTIKDWVARYIPLNGAPEPNPMFTCIVCESDVSLCEIPIQLHGATCNHLIHTCIPCVHRFIRTAVTSHPRLTPSCPECPMPLSQKTIEYYMDEETKKTLEDRTTSEHLEADDTFVWCAGGCGNGQLHAGGSSQPIVTCKKCGKKTCFVHKCIWHGGVTCEEWEAVLKEDEQAKRRFRDRVDTQLLERINHARDERASETYLEKSPAKKCPKCGVWIEKIGGCFHMTCTQCNYQFCWDCFGDYKKILATDNSAHEDTCAFNTRNLVSQTGPAGNLPRLADLNLPTPTPGGFRVDPLSVDERLRSFYQAVNPNGRCMGSPSGESSTQSSGQSSTEPTRQRLGALFSGSWHSMRSYTDWDE